MKDGSNYNYMILINKIINAGMWNNHTHLQCFYRHTTNDGNSLYDNILNFEKANVDKYGSIKNQPMLEELLWEEGEVSVEQVKKDVYQQIDKGHNVSVGNYFIEKDMVKYAHKKKVKIIVWTVNTIDEQKEFVKWGVNEIISNFALKH
jgi:glycerophosphoryl diester phosphodiesterase